jgi:hypothetical protein
MMISLPIQDYRRIKYVMQVEYCRDCDEEWGVYTSYQQFDCPEEGHAVCRDCGKKGHSVPCERYPSELAPRELVLRELTPRSLTPAGSKVETSVLYPDTKEESSDNWVEESTYGAGNSPSTTTSIQGVPPRPITPEKLDAAHTFSTLRNWPCIEGLVPMEITLIEIEAGLKLCSLKRVDIAPSRGSSIRQFHA